MGISCINLPFPILAWERLVRRFFRNRQIPYAPVSAPSSFSILSLCLSPRLGYHPTFFLVRAGAQTPTCRPPTGHAPILAFDQKDPKHNKAIFGLSCSDSPHSSAESTPPQVTASCVLASLTRFLRATRVAAGGRTGPKSILCLSSVWRNT